MKIIKVKRWTLSDVKNKPDHLFIFGDNDIKKGKGGQAVIREEPNAMGIPTKKIPTRAKSAYYTDDELTTNQNKIDHAIKLIIAELPKYEVLVLPADGIGTGLSELPTRAPLTFKYLKEKLKELINDAKYVRRVPAIKSNEVKLHTVMHGLDGKLYQSVQIKKKTSPTITNTATTTTTTTWKPYPSGHLFKTLAPDLTKFTVYGTKTCPYCSYATKLLDERNQPYIYHDITNLKTEAFEVLKDKLGKHRTVPIIFYAGELVGGYNDLKICLKFDDEDENDSI